MLNGEIDTTLERPSPSIPLTDEALGIEPKAEHTLYVMGSHCLEYLPESSQDQQGIRTFGYEVTLHFADEKSKEAFQDNPNAGENGITIRRTAEEMMQPVLELENARDAGGFYGEPGDPGLINTINENTYGDIDVVQQDLGTIVQSTFPDAGITSVTIDYLTVKDGACPAPFDPSFAENLTAPPPTPNIAMANSGAGLQHFKR